MDQRTTPVAGNRPLRRRLGPYDPADGLAVVASTPGQFADDTSLGVQPPDLQGFLTPHHLGTSTRTDLGA